MKDSYETQKRYYELGESYFWFSSIYDVAMRFAEPFLKERKARGPLKLLDAGCGPGNLIGRLLPWGEVVGTDASADALDFCRHKHAVEVHQSLLKDMPFADGTFDFVFALEVLEHIEDDVEAMREIRRILKPDGFLVATVPAFMSLWGYHDEKYGHVRRYTKSELTGKGRQAGFEVQRSTYYKCSFFLPLWLMRTLKKLRGQQVDDFKQVGPRLNRFLQRFLIAEASLAAALHVPFGPGLLVVLHNPATAAQPTPAAAAGKISV